MLLVCTTCHALGLEPIAARCDRCGAVTCERCGRCMGCRRVLCVACDTVPTPAHAGPGDQVPHPHIEREDLA